MPSKKDELLSSAKTLLWERGYEATSPRDIQEASGAGQGSFYHHFDGKLDLAATAIEEVAQEMREAATQLLDPALPGLERVARFLTQGRDGLKGCRLGRFASETSIAEARIRGPVKLYFDHLEGLLASALADAKGRGDLDTTAEPAALARMLIAVLQGGFVLSRVHRDREAINAAAQTALTLLRSPVRRS